MKTWLSIEKNSISITYMTFNQIADCELISNLSFIGILKRNFDWPVPALALPELNKICTWMDFGSVSDKFSQLFNIVSSDLVWIS